MSFIDKLRHFKTKRVKGNLQGWFDGEFLESISLQEKLCRKSKHSKLNVDKEIYIKARNKSHRLILQKKESDLKTNERKDLKTKGSLENT